jgi:hypothetical protein
MSFGGSDRAALRSAAADPDLPEARPSTGTEDDDDEPEDEHDGENEASQREQRDTTQLPEEIERDDEDDLVAAADKR